MKVIRKTLHPLQEAAGDKENLVGAGRALRGSNSKEDPNKAMRLVFGLHYNAQIRSI